MALLFGWVRFALDIREGGAPAQLHREVGAASAARGAPSKEAPEYLRLVLRGRGAVCCHGLLRLSGRVGGRAQGRDSRRHRDDPNKVISFQLGESTAVAQYTDRVYAARRWRYGLTS